MLMRTHCFVFSSIFAALILSSSHLCHANSSEAFPAKLDADLSAGASAIYQLDFKSAEEHFHRAIQLQPEHPAAHFFLLMLTWYRLTYDSLIHRNPALEKTLLDQAESTFAIAKEFSKSGQTETVGYLYMGGASGAKGWYHVTRSQWVRAYFAGKKGYGLVRKAVNLDPELYDAYLGVGMYEYYAATLGPTLKVLASFAIRGDKESALRNLRLAELKSRYVRLEAAYFLWNAALEEGRLDDALEKMKFLNRSFPDSPLFKWCEIQTLYVQKKWEEALKKSEEFISLANAGPQPENFVSPYELLMSKVLYHSGMSALELKDIKLAKHYFDRTIDQPAEFQGWKVLAYLRRGELFDLESKRLDALGKYRAVLRFPEFWDTHKIARQRIKEPYH